jgi:hypothetical protein
MTAAIVALFFADVTAVSPDASSGTQPAASASVPARPEPGPREAQERHRRVMFKFSAGAFYNRSYTVNVWGGHALVAVGSTADNSSWEINFQYARGRSEHGLDLNEGRVGFSYDWFLDRFRFGLGPTIGFLSLERATRSGDITTALYGFDVHASFDVVRVSNSSAFFVDLRAKVETGIWGPLLLVGFRTDAGATGSP